MTGAPLVPLPSAPVVLPALIAGAGQPATLRFIEFFTVNIRNANTRAAGEFLLWCETRGARGFEGYPTRACGCVY